MAAGGRLGPVGSSSGPWGLAFTAVGFAAATAGIKYFLGLTQVASFDRLLISLSSFSGGSWDQLWKEEISGPG